MPVQLSAQQALDIFPTLWAYIGHLVEENVFNPLGEGDFKDMLASGKAIPFIEVQAGEIVGCAIVRPIHYPTGWVAEIIYGEADATDIWEKGLEAVEQWARKHKMSAVEVNGRIGWERLLRAKEYSKILVVMRKPLTDGKQD